MWTSLLGTGNHFRSAVAGQRSIGSIVGIANRECQSKTMNRCGAGEMLVKSLAMAEERGSGREARGPGPLPGHAAKSRIEEQVAAILAAWGMAPDLVPVTVDAIVYSDVAGIDSHGISMLMMYEGLMRKGTLDLRARPRVVRESATTALVDGGAGLGHPAGALGMGRAIEKALATGVGVASVFNSHHFGAAGYYAAMAPARGLLGLVTSSARICSVIPTRGSSPMLGTNPFAFAAPAARNAPFLLDMATSTAAANKVRMYAGEGKPIPEGWVLDGEGRAITDSRVANDVLWNGRGAGGLTPLGGTSERGGHKGYGLGVMVQLLSSALSGGSFSPIRERHRRGNEPDNVGHFLLAIDPRAFRPEGAFEDDVDAVIDELHRTPAIDPALPVLVAGDPEAERRARRLREGIPVPATLGEQLRALCERCGAPFLLT
jgi:LDH2 family malate/lactate/ureidoglycolate dehydrogenase